MKSRAVLASLCFGAALLFCSAQNAEAGFGLFGNRGGCCEPSCYVVDDCCDPCGSAPRCGVLSRLRGLFDRHNCCEPSCCFEEPTCCAPEPSCCVVEPECGCYTESCCAPRCRIIEKIGGLFRRSHCGHHCGCEPSCGFEPSCGCNG